MEEFPRLIEVINPLYASNPFQEWTLVEYLAHCSHRKVPLKDIVAEVGHNHQSLCRPHPEFAKK